MIFPLCIRKHGSFGSRTHFQTHAHAQRFVLVVHKSQYKTLIIEGSLEVKLPTIWTDEKQRLEESVKRREEERRPEKRKSQKKEDAGARKGRKVAKHGVFSNDLWLRRVEKQAR